MPSTLYIHIREQSVRQNQIIPTSTKETLSILIIVKQAQNYANNYRKKQKDFIIFPKFDIFRKIKLKLLMLESTPLTES